MINFSFAHDIYGLQEPSIGMEARNYSGIKTQDFSLLIQYVFFLRKLNTKAQMIGVRMPVPGVARISGMVRMLRSAGDAASACTVLIRGSEGLCAVRVKV